MAVSLDAVQARFDVEQGGGQPSIALLGGGPAFDFWVRCSINPLMDSRQLVVRKESLSRSPSPNRLSVKDSSKPSTRLLAADSLHNCSFGFIRRRAALAWV